MKLKQTLGQTAIVHAVGIDDSRYDITVATLLEQLAVALAVKTAASLVKLGKERQFVDTGNELSHGRTLLKLVSAAVDILEESLEHTRSRTRCGHKLTHLAAMAQIFVPAVKSGRCLIVGQTKNTRVNTGCILDFQIGKSGYETRELGLGLSLADTFLSKLLFVFRS